MTVASSDETQTILLARGAVVVFSGNLLGRALGFLYHFLLARFLGASAYGLFLLGLSIVSLASGIADGGLRWGVLRWASMAWGRGDRAELKGTIVAGTGLGLGGSILAGAAVAIGGWIWAGSWFRSPDLNWILPWLALSIPALVLTMLMVHGLQALRQFVPVTLLPHGLDPILRVLVFTLLSLAGWKILAAVVSHLVATIATAAVAAFWLRWRSPALAPEVLSRYPVGPLLIFSLPLLLSNLAAVVVQWSDTLIIGSYLSAREVGIYGTSLRLASLSGIFLSAVSAAFGPQIYALFAKGDLTEVKELYLQSTRWLIALGLPVFLFTIINASSLLALFGRDFVEGRWALSVLAAATLVVGGTGAAGDVVFMVGRSRAVLCNSFVASAIAIVLNLWLVPRYGILGAAIGSGSALALGNLINLVQGWWFAGFHPYHRSMFRPVSIALSVAAVQWWALSYLDGPALLMIGAAGLMWLMLYPVALVCLGLGAEDRALWSRMVAQLRPRVARV